MNVLSSIPGNSFAYFNGTSMASPHAAGVAALAASEDTALLSDPVALKDHVMDTGKPVPAMAGITVTGDMVDARAVLSADNTAPKVTNPRPAQDSRIKDRTPLIGATVRDAETNLVKSDIQLLVDGQARAFSYDTATDRLSHPSGTLTYGNHSVRVKATDGELNANRFWTFRVVRP